MNSLIKSLFVCFLTLSPLQAMSRCSKSKKKRPQSVVNFLAVCRQYPNVSLAEILSAYKKLEYFMLYLRKDLNDAKSQAYKILGKSIDTIKKEVQQASITSAMNVERVVHDERQDALQKLTLLEFRLLTVVHENDESNIDNSDNNNNDNNEQNQREFPSDTASLTGAASMLNECLRNDWLSYRTMNNQLARL